MLMVNWIMAHVFTVAKVFQLIWEMLHVIW
jgi:hypothetical protein